MLASPPDEDGPGAPRGAGRARGRRRSRRGLGSLLGWVVELAVAVARARCAGAFRGFWDSGCAGVVARARAGGLDRIRAAGLLRHLVRDLDSLVDRAGPLVGLPEPR